MSDFTFLFAASLIALAIPMIYSLTYFILERQRSSSKKTYIRFIFLYIIFIFIYIIFIFLYIESLYLLINFFNLIDQKYFSNYNDNLYVIFYIIILIIISIMYIYLYIKIMRKFFSFNDINLFFISKIIFIFLLIYIILKLGYKISNINYYYLLFYSIFSITLSWILFFKNILVQFDNSEKRKKQSDTNPSERDTKQEE